MKKIYLSALLAGITASAASAQKWVVMQDFEGEDAAQSVALACYDSETPSGTLAIETLATVDNPDNKAARISNKEWSTGIEVTIQLPEGKTLANYSKVGFDVNNVNMTYKPLFLLLNGVTVQNDVSNAIGDTKGWVLFNGNPWEFDIPATVDATATELKVLVVFRAHDNGFSSYALDNIRLLDTDGPAGPVDPVDPPVGPVDPENPDESANGTVTDGWLMVEDFQNSKAGDPVAIYNYFGHTPSGSASVIADPTAGTNLAGVFEGGDYNTLLEIPVILPEGKTIADYTRLAFDLYRFQDDDDHKEIYISADDAVIYYKAEEYISHAPVATWTTKSYDIPEGTASGNSVKLHIGIKTNKGHYAIDNIKLKERPSTVLPEDFYETANGTVQAGVLMVNDFQQHNAIDITLPTWTRGDEAKGEARTVADPTDSRNIVASFSGESNYETVHDIEVILPAGKTLANYKAVKFDLYRTDKDASHKVMRVYADDHRIKYDNEEYIEHTTERNKWEEKEYNIPAGHSINGIFNLRIGIESDAPDYLIDNIRLVEKTTSTGIDEIGADSPTTVTTLPGAITVTGNGPVSIYTVTGQAVTSITVNGSAVIDLPAGLYIVSTPSCTVKAIVR
ncbi:MAG: T9SS type A sorting domain-containing protein [Muribaculaceae bacterium]|nr:T9SS type A sorting domain-containing protein [Muribaculaceae bacterium]